MDLCSIIIITIIILSTLYVICFTNNENFSNTNQSINLFSKPQLQGINLSLTILNSKLKLQYLYTTILNMPMKTYSKKSPILMLSGLGDNELYYNNTKIWPSNCMVNLETILCNKKIKLNYSNSKNNYFSTFINLLESSNYVSGKSYSLEPYDFTQILQKDVLVELFSRIKNNIENMVQINNKKAVLIGYQLGATLLLLFLNRQEKQWINLYIDNFVLVGSIIGGCVEALNNYINGFYNYSSSILKLIDGLQLLAPSYYLYGNTDIIQFDEVNYSAEDYTKLLSYLKLNINLDESNILIKEAFKIPNVHMKFITGTSNTFFNNNFIAGDGFVTETQIKEIITHYSSETQVDVFRSTVHSAYLLENYDVIIYLLNLLKI